MGELRDSTTAEVAAVVALFESMGRSARGGLGAKAFNGLKESRGAIRLDGAASGASALSEDVDISVQGTEPWERLAGDERGNLLL